MKYTNNMDKKQELQEAYLKSLTEKEKKKGTAKSHLGMSFDLEKWLFGMEEKESIVLTWLYKSIKTNRCFY